MHEISSLSYALCYREGGRVLVHAVQMDVDYNNCTAGIKNYEMMNKLFFSLTNHNGCDGIVRMLTNTGHVAQKQILERRIRL